MRILTANNSVLIKHAFFLVLVVPFVASAIANRSDKFPAASYQDKPKLIQIVLQEVRKELPESAKISVEQASVSTAARPGTQVPVDANVVILSPHPPVGLVNFELSWQEQGQARRTYGNAIVKASVPVAVAKTSIRPNEVLDQTNVGFETRELGAYLSSGYFLNWDSLRVRRANAFFRVGQVMTSANTQVPVPVTAGQTVDLINQKNNLRIVAKVRALENGRLYDWIRVENPSSKKVLQARITGAGEVSLR